MRRPVPRDPSPSGARARRRRCRSSRRLPMSSFARDRARKLSSISSRRTRDGARTERLSSQRAECADRAAPSSRRASSSTRSPEPPFSSATRTLPSHRLLGDRLRGRRRRRRSYSSVERGPKVAYCRFRLEEGVVILLSDSLATRYDPKLIERRLLSQADRLLFAGVVGYLASRCTRSGSGGSSARRRMRAAASTSGGRHRQRRGALSRCLRALRGRLGQLDRARSAFIANASHELRTPSSPGAALELWRLGRGRGRGRISSRRSRAGDRLAKLATDLLDLSRLDAAGCTSSTSCRPLRCARVVCADFGALAERKRHSARRSSRASVRPRGESWC